MVSLYPAAGRPGPILRSFAPAIRLAALFLSVSCLAGCSSRRTVVITALPQDATINIDGAVEGRGRVEKRLSFAGGQVHTVLVSRLGFAEQIISLGQPPEGGALQVKLDPQTKRIQFRVSPLPAIIKVDGKPVAPSATDQASTSLEFSVDALGKWVPRVASAERPGYRTAQRVIKFTDRDSTYTLALEPERKDVTIVTDPPGAQVFVDGQLVGEGPKRLENFVIPVDPQTNEWVGKKIRATKPGYEPAERTISWDEGKEEYVLKLTPAIVAVAPSGTTAPAAAPATQIAAAPGTIPSETPAPSPLPATNPASPTPPAAAIRTIALLRVTWAHSVDGWHAMADEAKVATTSTTAEPTGGPRVAQIASAPTGATVGSLASSPDGMTLVYSLLTKKGDALRSQVIAHPLEADRPEKQVTDGKSLDLTPTFAPDSASVLFARARDGGAAIFQATVDPAGEPKAVAGAEGGLADLWPSLDSAPQPRLYVESRPADGSAAKLVSIALPEGKRTDLKQAGSQPRVSPSADAVVFTRADPRTGKRDLFLLREGAEEPANLTNSPDDDDFDPAWSKDGGRIAFASTRAANPKSNERPAAQDAARDANLWVVDLAKPEAARQITGNSAWDDSPAWDGDGMALYFRSNRGGEWGVWKVELK